VSEWLGHTHGAQRREAGQGTSSRAGSGRYSASWLGDRERWITFLLCFAVQLLSVIDRDSLSSCMRSYNISWCCHYTFPESQDTARRQRAMLSDVYLCRHGLDQRASVSVIYLARSKPGPKYWIVTIYTKTYGKWLMGR